MWLSARCSCPDIPVPVLLLSCPFLFPSFWGSVSMFTPHRPHYPSTFGFQGLLIPTSTHFPIDTKVCCWRLTPDSWSFSFPFHVAAGTNGLAPPFWSQLAATLAATLPLCSFKSLPVTLQWVLRTTQSPGEASLTPLLQGQLHPHLWEPPLSTVLSTPTCWTQLLTRWGWLLCNQNLLSAVKFLGHVIPRTLLPPWLLTSPTASV